MEPSERSEKMAENPPSVEGPNPARPAGCRGREAADEELARLCYAPFHVWMDVECVTVGASAIHASWA